LFQIFDWRTLNFLMIFYLAFDIDSFFSISIIVWRAKRAIMVSAKVENLSRNTKK
jgi:hypothetical protein